ncbi:mesothelin [Hyperolius riggenbachi]|uniref:mesothelin n=1 Tax=Hyperolius riggenbachi TaxID=752182 RepID=UPI0035A31FC8
MERVSVNSLRAADRGSQTKCRRRRLSWSYKCPPPSLNSSCSLTFQQYACSNASFLAALPDNILVNLSSCYNSTNVSNLDSQYATLYLSKLDINKTNAEIGQLNSAAASVWLTPDWGNFLFNGISNRIILMVQNTTVPPPNWIPVNYQPFLSSIVLNPMVRTCLQQQNVSCDISQELVRNLDAAFPLMNDAVKKATYPALKSFLSNQQTVSGSACSQNVNSSSWLKKNFGQFSQMADLSDFTALNPNFSPLDVLPSLTTPQLVSFSLNTTMTPSVVNSIVGTLQNATSVSNFLSTFNAALSSNNRTTLDPSLATAILRKTLQVNQPSFNTFDSSNWTQLLQGSLSSFLPYISTDTVSLLPNNLSCDSYHVVLSSLNPIFNQIPPGNQQAIYKKFIKPYLAKRVSADPAVCYNQSATNSSSWFVTNMGSFMTYTGKEDMVLFANDTMLQNFASDPSSIQLASKLNFSQDTASYFTSLLTTSGNASAVLSLPSVFLCYLQPSALNSGSAADLSNIITKINSQCFNTTAGQAPSNPSSDQVQMAMSMVSKLNITSSADIVNLGQSAVGLSQSQINQISPSDLQSSISTLANVNGWNAGQTKSIVNKLLSASYSITNLSSLGSLVSGLPSQTLLQLNPNVVLNATKDPQFVSKLSSAPPVLQNAFVKKIIAADSSNIVKNIPGNLVSFIPNSILASQSSKPSLQDVNGKSWTPSQASLFFDDVLSSTTNYTQLSPSVLQGFTCASGSKVDNNGVKSLVKAMKTQGAALTESQLTCLSRQVTSKGYPTDLDQYPKEIFFYLNANNYSATVANTSCKDFYSNVGAANISVLQKGSKLRNTLLTQALSCLNVSGFALTDAHIQVLGNLTCDLNSSYIGNSSSSLLSSMSACNSLSDAQQVSIQTALSSGNSVFGNPTTWTSDTLNSLGKFSGFLPKTVLQNISTVSLTSWAKNALQKSTLTRSQFANIVNNLSQTRSRRDASCPAGSQITSSNVNNPTLPLSYTPTLLDNCLDNTTLSNYLNILGNLGFTTDQQAIIKKKLDVLYPGGYPDTVVSNLGAIASVSTDADISKWNITSEDTLASLLSGGLPDSVALSVISRYINLNNSLSGTAINAIGSQRICLLTSAQLANITSSALSDAMPLDVSSCNQSAKNVLYTKANASYQGMVNQSSAYYKLIQPYLGGATLPDLKTLVATSPNMDIMTFVSLNPSVAASLTVSDVKTLLGNNTADLVTQNTTTVVSQWIQNQKQSDLDTLGLGLVGGIRDSSASSSSTSSPSNTTPSKTNSAPLTSTCCLSFTLAVVAAIFLSWDIHL